MTREQIRTILDRVLTWPPEAQEEAVATLQSLEEELLGAHDLSPADREALERSAEDIRQGRYATDEDVERVFGRYRLK